MNLASTIDHTILKADCRLEDVKRLCDEAMEYKFASVCIPPFFVKEAAKKLEDSRVKVCTVIGFPYGYSATPGKVEEVKRAINDGVDEVDVVVNLCAVKEGNWNYVKSDLESLTMASHSKGKIIKVILETALLNQEELSKLCEICGGLGVDYVKTSTGVTDGATLEVVTFMKSILPKNVKIKASGGIRTIDQVRAFVNAGASRIGTSSGILIAQQEEEV